jgi:hypothetical protein
LCNTSVHNIVHLLAFIGISWINDAAVLLKNVTGHSTTARIFTVPNMTNPAEPVQKAMSKFRVLVQNFGGNTNDL